MFLLPQWLQSFAIVSIRLSALALTLILYLLCIIILLTRYACFCFCKGTQKAKVKGASRYAHDIMLLCGLKIKIQIAVYLLSQGITILFNSKVVLHVLYIETCRQLFNIFGHFILTLPMDYTF